MKKITIDMYSVILLDSSYFENVKNLLKNFGIIND